MKRPMLVSGITTTVCGALFLIFGNKSSAAVCVLSASVLLFFIINRKKPKKYIFIPAACCFAILASTFFLLFDMFTLQKSHSFESENAEIYAKVLSCETNGSADRYTLKTIKIDGKSAELKIDFYTYKNYDFELYDCICISGAALKMPRGSDMRLNGSRLSEGITLTASSADDVHFVYKCEKTPYYYCLKAKSALTAEINTYLEPAAAGGVLCGMIFGDKSTLAYDIGTAFSKSGVSHLLAVSGLHTSLWCGLIILLLSLFGASDKIKALFCTLFLSLFCITAGFTPSVVRACIMSFLSLCAPLFSRRADSLNSLGLAAALMVVHNPYILTSAAFILSVSATLGVIFVSGYEEKLHAALFKIKFTPVRRLLDFIVSGFLVSTAAGLFTLPACAYYFGTFSLIAPVTNLVCVKPAFYAMICGAAAAVCALPAPLLFKSAARLLFGAAEFIINYLIAVTSSLSQFKYSALPVDGEVFGICLAVTMLLTAIAFALKAVKKSRFAVRIISPIAAAVLVFSLIFPLIPSGLNCKISILPGSGTCVSIRCGTHFAVINCAELPYGCENSLPTANCQSLDLLAVQNIGKTADESFYGLIKSFEPKNILISRKVHRAISNTDETPTDITVADNGTFYLADKICIEIIDTNGVCCVIIKGNKKTVVILPDVRGAAQNIAALPISPDITVGSATCFDGYGGFCDTIAVCTDGGELPPMRLEKHCRRLMNPTAESVITLNI